MIVGTIADSDTILTWIVRVYRYRPDATTAQLGRDRHCLSYDRAVRRVERMMRRYGAQECDWISPLRCLERDTRTPEVDLDAALCCTLVRLPRGVARPECPVKRYATSVQRIRSIIR